MTNNNVKRYLYEYVIYLNKALRFYTYVVLFSYIYVNSYIWPNG